MRVKHLAAGLVACAALALAGPAMGGDTIRLNLPGNVDAPTLNLKAGPADLDLDTTLTRWGRGWGGGWGGGRFHGGWGWRGGVGWRGGWGGYRAWGPRWGGYYGGLYPRYWGGYYGGGYYGGGWYPSIAYYSYPSYAYYGSYFPCSMNGSATYVQPATPSMPRIIEMPSTPMPTIPNGSAKPVPNGTFDYNGGPMTPVPMPRAPEPSASDVRPTRPMLLNELLVSAEAAPKAGKWVYPAYGEAPRRSR